MKKAPYKNVISLGLVLDKNGQKMSKSKGNIVSPWDMIQKHGVDAVRWYFYTVNPPGEAKKFDELEIAKVSRQFFTLVYNSFVFFNLYGKASVIPTKAPASSNVLDKWVLARLHETIGEVSTHLEEYEIGDAARRIEVFAGDFSRWFIRRSRRRLQKPESEKELQEVSKVFGYVLLELARLLAPFTPFFADALYKSLITSAKASVHLDVWPTFNKKLVDQKLIEAMEEVRLVASVALAKRAEAGAKVRQPLTSLSLKSEKLKGKKALLEILKDEVNVKEIRFDKTQAEDVILDLVITQELKDEGLLREFVRVVQDLRQDAGFSPKDMMVLHVEAPQQILYVLHKYEASAKRDINAKVIEYKRVERFDAEIKTKLGDADIWLAVRKKE
jgi:isoleucyl-tRNA synthetase